MQLTLTQLALHQRALDLCTQHRRTEALLIVVLKEIDKTKLYRKLGQPSLYIYAVKTLGLSESVAYAFISVARKSAQIAPLLVAIEKQSLTIAKASRIVSALTKDNSEALIEFARTHNTRETEFEVARLRPKCRAPDRVKPLSENLLKLEMSVCKSVFAKLTRARALVASQTGHDTGLEGVLDAVLTEFLKRRDPVKRAQRALAKRMTADSVARPSTVPLEVTPKVQPELCAHRVLRRQPLTAAQKHSVFARDGGRCTHIDTSGARCDADRWLHLHHLTPVSRGGTNDAENLATLCSFHHDLAHQLSLPIEGQVTWLRERRVRYSV